MRSPIRNCFLAVCGLGVFAFGFSVNAASIEDNIQTIKAVDKFSKGHAEAIVAVKDLSNRSADSLIAILKGFDGANPLAVNWLRGAVDSIADRELKKSGKLPTKALEDFVTNTSNVAEARRLAYEWLLKVDPASSDRLIPGMLHDVSPEFRRDAVERLIAQATKAHEAKDLAAEKSLLKDALSGASDDDQVKAIAKPLRELGETVDLQKHFGFLADWYLIGPFDNAEL